MGSPYGVIPAAALMYPLPFGPSTVSPCSRAKETISASSRAPSSPVSPKPAVRTT